VYPLTIILVGFQNKTPLVPRGRKIRCDAIDDVIADVPLSRMNLCEVNMNDWSEYLLNENEVIGLEMVYSPICR